MHNKMLKIHFVIMPFFRLDRPPLGVACLCSHLRKQRVEIDCTDFRLFQNNVNTFTYLGYQDNYVMDVPELPLILAIVKNWKEGRNLCDGLDETIADYIKDRPLSFFKLRQDIANIKNIIDEHLCRLSKADIVLFTVYETNFLFSIMCSLLLRQKKQDITIIYGGPQISQSENSRKLVLKLGIADLTVVGEGEESVLEIIKSYRANKPFAVKGTMAYDKNKKVFFTQPAQPLDINNLFCPDFSKLDLNGYPRKNFELPLYTTRGCLFKCNFCNEWKMWHPFRQLKPKKVIDWMKELNRDYGAFRFYFVDSLLNASLPWLEEFSDILLKEKLKFLWYGYFRANMSKSLAEKLKRSGLCKAAIGIETFSPGLLKSMNKKRAMEDNLEAIEAFCSCDLPLEVSNIIGFPHESESDFKKRWEIYLGLIKKYPYNLLINIEPFQLRPSSPMYENLPDYGLTLKKWNDKIVNLLPEVKDIVCQIPMAVEGKPRAEAIIRRMNTMQNSFQWNRDIGYGYEIGLDKTFLRHLLSSLKYLHNTKINFINFQAASTKARKNHPKQSFALCRNDKVKYVISQKEKFMWDKCKGILTFHQIIEELAQEFNKTKKQSQKEFLKFLNDLLDRDILFRIS